MTKDVSTEKRILDAARQVFVQQGMSGARMQEIADVAGINKAMLHYYFRSKEALFERVFTETLQVNAPVLFGILSKEAPLKEKVDEFVEHYLEILRKNPFMPLFLLGELSQNPDKLMGKIGPQVSMAAAGLRNQLKMEAEKGTIRPIEPIDFMSTIMGLCIFPVMAKPLLKPLFGLTEPAYEEFLNRRRREVPSLVWHYLTDQSITD